MSMTECRAVTAMLLSQKLVPVDAANAANVITAIESARWRIGSWDDTRRGAERRESSAMTFRLSTFLAKVRESSHCEVLPRQSESCTSEGF